MTDLGKQLSRSHDIGAKVVQVFQTRANRAQEEFSHRVRKAHDDYLAGMPANTSSPWEMWTGGVRYAVDLAQRSVLFWDTLRQRGNNFVEHTRKGLPPVLHFDFETVVDGRALERPVNYA